MCLEFVRPAGHTVAPVGRDHAGPGAPRIVDTTPDDDEKPTRKSARYRGPAPVSGTQPGAWALNKQDGTAYAVEDGGTVVHKRLP